MRYRNIGKLDWQVSEIGFGAWAIGGDMWGPQNDAVSIASLHKAVDLGVNFIDTAQGYGKGHSEEIIGKFLKERKEEIFVATKIPPVEGTKWPVPENSDANLLYPADYIISQCEQSLKRLKRDYVDIYQFHTWAARFNVQDEWFEAIQKLKEEGKIRAAGVSVPDSTPDNVIGALAKGKIDSVQVIYNLFEQYPNWNLFPICHKLGIGVVVRVPFDEGSLTGKFNAETKFHETDIRRFYFRGKNLQVTLEKVEEIKKYLNGKSIQVCLPEFALRFCLSSSAVSTVIPGIRNIAQAEMNTAVSDGILLDKSELHDLEKFAWRRNFWVEEIS
ncbi:MAG: aldo/keto reductase [Bacteroidota bacterium]